MATKFQNINEEYEFAQACAEYAANKISQNLTDDIGFEEIFNNTLERFTKEVMTLTDAGFACAIDNFKEMLAQKVQAFSSPNISTNERELLHSKREEIAIIMAEQLKVLNTDEQEKKRDILIKVITDFHQLESVANSGENEYYKKKWNDLKEKKTES